MQSFHELVDVTTWDTKQRRNAVKEKILALLDGRRPSDKHSGQSFQILNFDIIHAEANHDCGF